VPTPGVNIEFKQIHEKLQKNSMTKGTLTRTEEAIDEKQRVKNLMLHTVPLKEKADQWSTYKIYTYREGLFNLL